MTVAQVPALQPPDLLDLVPLPWLVGGLTLVVLAAALTGVITRGLPGGRRRSLLPLRWRARLRLHAGPGFAGNWELWRTYGLPHARRVAKSARPSLGVWARRRPGGWRQFATLIGRAHGWIVRRRVFADSEAVVLTFAKPRKGKSAAGADRLIDAPGPVVGTSIRDDLIRHTAGPRSQVGLVHVWNPEGLGQYASTMRWDPVSGCTDTRVAARRAGYMVEAQTARGLSDSDFWDDQTSMILSAYLHAAALAGLGMREVYAWCGGTDEQPLEILRRAKHANPADRDNASHFITKMADRTQSSITTTLRRTLQFMRDPEVARILTPAPGEGFEVEAFLSSTDTLYLVSDGNDSTTQPLFAAFIAELAYVARRVAATKPGGRLDPPLTLELDEIANTASIPVHKWASWMGGTGISMHIYAQSWTQLEERYGDQVEALWACAGMIVVYGGTSELPILERVSKLAGQVTVRGRDRITPGADGERHRERTEEQVDVLPMSELRLPRFTAVVIGDDAPPTVVRTPRVWKRRDHRRWRRTGGPAFLDAPRQRFVPEADPSLRHPHEDTPMTPAVAPHERNRRPAKNDPPPLRVVSTETGSSPTDRPDEPPPLRRTGTSGADAMPWDDS